jgi:two-component system cell cycle sensor histidine kinase/response regulator CckA
LSRAGARVTSREDGQAALELILTGVQADLLLTDLVMPRMGGAELAREVSKLRPELPVAFMTGYADTDALRELELADPQHRRPILNKPFTIDDLVSAVTRALAANSSG